MSVMQRRLTVLSGPRVRLATDELSAAIASGGIRLVTLTGAGGSGTLRMAVRITSQIAVNYSDGICYVELALIINPVAPATVDGLRQL